MVGNALPWLEFLSLLRGLLSADTRVYRKHAPKPDRRERREVDDG